MDSKKNKKDDWIKLASKSRPGRFYLFNKATGETQWLPLTKDSSTEATTRDSKKETPPKLPVSKPSSKTPAQDRLKRLQHNLKVNQKRSPPNKTMSPTKPKKATTQDKEQENRDKDKATISSPTKPRTRTSESSPRKPLPSPRARASKRPHPPSDQEKPTKESTSPKRTSQLSETLNTSSSPSTSNKTLSVEAEEVVSDASPSVQPPNDTSHLQNETPTKSSTLNSLRTGIVKKIKEICKFPFNSSKKPPDEQTKENKSLSRVINTTPFKPTKKTKDNLRLSASLQETITQLRADQDISKSSNATLYSTPKNLNIPTYQRGSANTRLERLRQSLQMQQPSTSKTTITSLPTSSSFSETANKSLEPTAFNNNLNSSTNTSQTANYSHTSNDEVEAMDWQPILKEEPIEISSSESIISNEINSNSTKTVHSDNEGTMGDIYDTVNENLLRFSAEKHKDFSGNKKKWQKDYYYFVVDTNVFLSNLCFIDDLSKMKLCDTSGSMLYIPYCVLQELDILKMRSGTQEGVKTLAVRAIKYLNKKFESKSSHLQAQSALEERNRLIKINCADDSIINCCLQIKEHVPNLLLLTEDVNLRNKAICNNILVSTKSDLVSKHYDTNDGDNDKS